jgi:hypothetical protein
MTTATPVRPNLSASTAPSRMRAPTVRTLGSVESRYGAIAATPKNVKHQALCIVNDALNAAATVNVTSAALAHAVRTRSRDAR